MNRKIKFRQFSNGRWHYWGFVKEGVFVGPLSDVRGQKAVSYQFTGLCDRNGKEIYESDIVTWPGWDGKTYQVCYDRWGIPALAGIKTCEGGDFKEFEMDYNATPGKCEVIGNIYENPELLKDKEGV